MERMEEINLENVVALVAVFFEKEIWQLIHLLVAYFVQGLSASWKAMGALAGFNPRVVGGLLAIISVILICNIH